MRRILVLTLVGISLASAAFAQWTFVDSLKLGGLQSVSSLAVDSSGLVHAITSSPKYWIYDPALAKWSTASLPMSRNASIKVMPLGRLIATIDQKYIYYSDDHGATWRKLGSNLALTTVTGVAWNDTLLLAAGTGNVSGLMVLTPEDTSWLDVAATLPIAQFDGAYATRDGYLVVTQGRHVFRSRDGKHWDPKDTVAIDPKIIKTSVTEAGSVLALGQFSNSIFRSTDWGQTWTEPLRVSGLSSWQRIMQLKNGAIAVSAINGAFYLSTDDGVTWTSSRPLPLISPNAMTQDGENALIASSAIGVYRSRDMGIHWSAIDSGMSKATASELGISRDTLFVSLGSRGVYRSNGTSSGWRESSDSLLNNMGHFAFAGGRLYGITGEHLVYWNGASWTGLPNLFEDKPPVTFALSKTGRMFAGSSAQFFYLTPDNEWRTVTDLFGLNVKQCAADSAGNVYAAVGKDSVFCSTDDGVSWFELPNHPWATSVAAIIASADTLIVATTGGTENGMYSTADRGAHWTSRPYTLTNVRGVGVYQGRYFVYSGSALIEREAQETSWAQAQDIPSVASIQALAIAPSGSAFLSTNSGLYFRQLPASARSVRDAAGLESLVLYPNPARHAVSLSGASSFELLDVTGRRVGSSNDGVIDCSAFPAGVYQVRASDGRVVRLVVLR